MDTNIRKHLDLLGREVRDCVTGFKGVVSSISFDLYGCIQAAITPKAKEDGTIVEGRWFDAARLVFDQAVKKVMAAPSWDYGPAAEGVKGPAEKPASKY